ncbi:MAG: hypothetical protein RMK20_02045 [Verrucomicrobiales bacterium]|nr:hypothetical protein [Verrucomicrobiales bacterium]
MFGRSSARATNCFWRAGWLAPAAAGLLLAGVVITPQGVPTFSSPTSSNGWLELVLSNQSYAAYLPGSFQRAHNQLEAFAGTLSLAAATNAAP